MLSITAAVLLTITATVTPDIRPTTAPTRTLQEENQYLFKQLVDCGADYDKGIHDAYEAGHQDGIHDQWCGMQCKFLSLSKKRYKGYLADSIEPANKDNAGWYKKAARDKLEEINETKSRLKKEKCDCSQYVEE